MADPALTAGESLLIWAGIALCISQSAMFSGLNLAVFSLSRLRLEAAAREGDRRAEVVLALRRDFNLTLVTILLGNVAVNVLLTLLVDSVLVGVASFLFSTLVITLVGEIVPQAWFSRHALVVASALGPVLRLYRWLLLPLTWPIARLLDRMVGPELVPWFGEGELRGILAHHAEQDASELGRIETRGAINFLALDDLRVDQEGEPVDPDSVIQLPIAAGRVAFPDFARHAADPFLRRLQRSGRKWVVVLDGDGRPGVVINVPSLLRAALFDADFDPHAHCHHPLVVSNPAQRLAQVLTRLTVRPEQPGDDVVDEDLILLWTDSQRRIITGSDLLGRLLRGIVRRVRIVDT